MAPNHPVVRARQAHGVVKEFLPVLTALVTIAGAGLAAWEATHSHQDATQDDLLVDEHNKPLRVRYVLHREPFPSFLLGTTAMLGMAWIKAVAFVVALTFFVWLAFAVQPEWFMVGYLALAVVCAGLAHQRRYALAWQRRMTKHG